MDSRVPQTVGAMVVLAAMTVGCFWELVTRPRDTLVGPQRGGGNDLTSYFIPIRNYPRFCREQFDQPPFWNPFAASGVPYVGNPQSAVWYPPNWLCWWYDARDALSWILVAHHFWAGLGVYFLCRRFESGWLAATVGGSIFLAAPYLIAQTGEGHYAQLCNVAWMPWIFLAYERLRSAHRFGVFAVASTFAMSFFAGHVQETYYLVLILTVWMLIDAYAAWRTETLSHGVRLIGRWIVAGLATIGIVAVDFIPMLVYRGQMVRSSGFSSEIGGMISTGLLNVLQILNPFALGGPDSYGGGDKFFWESLFSFGVIPIVLALVGVANSSQRRPVWRLVGFSVVAVAFAFGSGSPVFEALFRLVPGMSMFRVPSRVLFFVSMSVALLAALGVDSTLRGRLAPVTRFEILLRRVCLICLLGGLAITWLSHKSGRQSRPADRLESATSSSGELTTAAERNKALVERAVRRTLVSRTVWALLFIAVGLVTVAERWPNRSVAAACLLLIAVGSELSIYSRQMLTVLPANALRTKTGFGSVYNYGADPYRVLAPMHLLSDLTAWEYAIPKVQAYDPVPLSRYVNLFRALTGKRDPSSDLIGFSTTDAESLDVDLLELLNVRYVIVDEKAPGPIDWPTVQYGSTINPYNIGRDARGRFFGTVYENPNLLPRAFVVGQTRRLTPDGDLIEQVRALKPREQVLMSDEFMPPGARAAFAPAKIVEYTPNRVVIEAELAAPGYLVLCDNWYPGWTATDNGTRTSIIPANICFRAIPLGGGKHTVVFRFQPFGLVTGGLVSLLTLAGLIVHIYWTGRPSGPPADGPSLEPASN